MEVYEDYEIKNIYENKDGRLRVYISNGKKHKVISYPKFLLEKYLNRYLTDTETVHHRDGNPLNNDIENLEVLERKIHCAKDVIRNRPVRFACPECGKEFILEGKRLCDAISNRKRHRAGPFCNKHCAGKYGAKVQNGMSSIESEIAKLEKYKQSEENA